MKLTSETKPNKTSIKSSKKSDRNVTRVKIWRIFNFTDYTGSGAVSGRWIPAFLFIKGLIPYSEFCHLIVSEVLTQKKTLKENLTGLIWIYLPFSKNRHFASKICWYRLKLKGMGTTNCTFDPSTAGDGVEFPCYVRSDLSTICVVRHCWKSTCDHFFNVLKMYFNVTRRCQTSSTQAQVFNTTWKQQKIANHKWNVRRIS